MWSVKVQGEWYDRTYSKRPYGYVAILNGLVICQIFRARGGWTVVVNDTNLWSLKDGCLRLVRGFKTRDACFEYALVATGLYKD